MIRYQPKTRKEMKKALEPFEDQLRYHVYLKKHGGGGTTVILALRPTASGGEYGDRMVETYEMAGKAIVARRVHQAELLDYRLLGVLSGRGANIWAKTGEGILGLIDVYGKRAKKAGFFKRLKRKLGVR